VVVIEDIEILRLLDCHKTITFNVAASTQMNLDSFAMQKPSRTASDARALLSTQMMKV